MWGFCFGEALQGHCSHKEFPLCPHSAGALALGSLTRPWQELSSVPHCQSDAAFPGHLLLPSSSRTTEAQHGFNLKKKEIWFVFISIYFFRICNIVLYRVKIKGAVTITFYPFFFDCDFCYLCQLDFFFSPLPVYFSVTWLEDYLICFVYTLK